MNYKIVSNGSQFCFVVEHIKDNNIAETQFVVPNTGDLSLLVNSLKMCENVLYKELNDKGISNGLKEIRG